MSLRTRFLLTYGVGGVLSLLVITLLIFYRMEAVMEKQLVQQFKYDSDNRIASLNHTFDELNERFISAVTLPMYKSMRYHQLTLNDSAYKNDIRQLELYFLEWVQQSTSLGEVRYVNQAGSEILRVDKNGIKRNLSDLSQDKSVKMVLNLKKNESRITIERINGQVKNIIWWIPIFVTARENYGVMGFSVSYQYIINNINQLAKSSEEYVCLEDRRGFVFVQDEQCRNNSVENWKNTKKLNLSNLAWWVTLSVDPEKFLTEVNQLRFIVFVIIFPIVAIIGFMISIIFTDQIIKVISQLVNAARIIGRGEWLKPVEVNRNDELGELAAEINRSAVMIEENRNALQQKNRDLDSYSYTLAHDLRAPLRSISSFSQILEMDAKEKLSEDELDALSRIIKASQRMSALIDDILELSRISNREIEVKSLSLSHLADKIVEQLRTSEPERNVRFEIEEGMIVKGDPQLLRLVLENILGNAWKYSQKTEYASIKFASKSDNNTGTVYYISDDGVGFDMQYVDKLFKPFQRLHKDSEFEGTGIGLASIKRMIERHEGRVWIESEVNKGTTIYFTLWDEEHN